jgi:hypothetical protein
MSGENQKTSKNQGSPETERKQYRNLKPTLAGPDDPIYKLGFVVGGRRLVRNQERPKKETK